MTPVFLPGKFQGQRSLAGHSPKSQTQLRNLTLALAFLPGESHGERSLAGYSPSDHKESDTTERLGTVVSKRYILEEVYLCLPKEGKLKR